MLLPPSASKMGISRTEYIIVAANFPILVLAQDDGGKYLTVILYSFVWRLTCKGS